MKKYTISDILYLTDQIRGPPIAQFDGSSVRRLFGLTLRLRFGIQLDDSGFGSPVFRSDYEFRWTNSNSVGRF